MFMAISSNKRHGAAYVSCRDLGCPLQHRTAIPLAAKQLSSSYPSGVVRRCNISTSRMRARAARCARIRRARARAARTHHRFARTPPRAPAAFCARAHFFCARGAHALPPAALHYIAQRRCGAHRRITAYKNIKSSGSSGARSGKTRAALRGARTPRAGARVTLL